jgi:hypothetical protein
MLSHEKRYSVQAEGPAAYRRSMLARMTTMSAGMTVAMVLVRLIILVFVVLGIAAFAGS